MTEVLPNRVLSWYGDDFTGSTDVLEAISGYMSAVLFLRQPDESTFARFAEYSAFGLAGSSRSESPAWMEERLPSAFNWLKNLGTAICHYKVCSTFDSSSSTGNIGKAIEIGRRTFQSAFVPIVVGAPSLGRYTAFGHLFAGAQGAVHRIDRHPTMSRHPVTPMLESDLRLHLQKQADLRIELLDLIQLELPDADERFQASIKNIDAVLIDVVNQSALKNAGRLLWRGARQPFVVGSSGVEYALIAHWKTENLIPQEARPATVRKEDRMIVLSGSCSPVTQQQIQYAGRNGFELIRLDARVLADGEFTSVAEKAGKNALEALSRGSSVVFFTAASPEDRIENFSASSRQLLGQRSGHILNRILNEAAVKRVVIAGGDTSSHGGQQLGIDALTFVSPLAPGAPLCRAWSQNKNRQDLEIVFKGGQCGSEDFFKTVLDGGVDRRN